MTLRSLPILAVILGACAVPPPQAMPPRPLAVAPPIPSMLALPGAGKDDAAFDADNQLCQRTAALPHGDNIYAQCMISHGEVVQTTPYFYGPPPPYRRPWF